MLNGNHETMNIAADCRYATAGGTAGFSDWMQRQQAGCELKKQCGCATGWSAVPKQGMLLVMHSLSSAASRPHLAGMPT